jgi:hypothetical protein
MLDTQSLCYVSAACSFFSKCAKDPLCYENLDLTTLVPKVNNAVVATMIQRAGKALRYAVLGSTDPYTSILCLMLTRKLQVTAQLMILRALIGHDNVKMNHHLPARSFPYHT